MKKAAFAMLVILITAVCMPAVGEYGFYGSDSYTEYAYIWVTLNSRLATRTGPGTGYDEPGSFLGAGYMVTILSRAYDATSDIWWVQVEFTDGGAAYRAYTNAKCFDGLDLSAVPEERAIGQCSIGSSMTGYYGPSYYYQPIGWPIPAGVTCTIFGYAYQDEGDFIQVEFYDAGLGQLRRAWIPDWAVDDYEMYYGF